ncbi:lipopolysaccharide biosynthesis protein [Granulosicoccaceae sp. 1_MG-2023]|nr:lipopolysaccharide biosynthesis protein [Granulosicoccaceae sp. 1_MG-2023]
MASDEIKKELRHGFVASAFTKYLSFGMRIIVAAVLARLLNPDEFGIYAIALVFLTFFSLLSESGVSVAVVQKRDLSEQDISNIFLFSLGVGISISLIFAFSAPAIGAFYEEPALVMVCQVLAISAVFNSAASVPRALMLKRRAFSTIARNDITAMICSALTAMISAWFGAKYYALVLQELVRGAIVLVLYTHASGIRVQRGFSWSSIGKIFNYSAFQFLFNMLNYFSRNIDNLLIGKYFGTYMLGFYNKSYSLMLLPNQTISQVITPALHPVFSQLQNEPARMYQYYVDMVRFLANLGVVISLGVFFFADEIILVLYGERWLDVAPMLRPLALTIGFQLILQTSGSVFQALGMTRELFFTGLVSSVMIIGAIVYGVHSGDIITLCTVYASSIFFVFLQNYFVLTRTGFKHPFGEFLRYLARPAAIYVLLFAGMWGLNLAQNQLFGESYFLIKLPVFFLLTALLFWATREFRFLATFGADYGIRLPTNALRKLMRQG